MAKSLDLYIDQGSDFLAVLPPVTNPNGSVFNLTGYTAACFIRRSYATPYAVTVTTDITNSAQGLIRLKLLAAETSGLQSSVLHTARWVYDVIVTEISTGIVTRVFEGLVIINPSVTSKPDSILLTPYIPEDYGGL